MESIIGHDHTHDHEHDHDHDHNDGDGAESVILAKGVSMAVLFCASMMCGLLPLLLAKWLRWIKPDEAGDLKSRNKVVMTLLSFGGGVLLSTTFMHLMPEIDHNVEYLQCEFYLFFTGISFIQEVENEISEK